MLNIEVIRFEAQDVITASVAAPAKPTHTHHWKFGESQAVGGADNTFKVNCSEPGCDAVGQFSQPIPVLERIFW